MIQLNDAEIEQIDDWMLAHVRGHHISNSPYGHVCEAYCRKDALKIGVNRVLADRKPIITNHPSKKNVIEKCEHGTPMRYALNCEGCIAGTPDTKAPPPFRPDPELIDNSEGNAKIKAADRAAAERYNNIMADALEAFRGRRDPCLHRKAWVSVYLGEVFCGECEMSWPISVKAE